MLLRSETGLRRAFRGARPHRTTPATFGKPGYESLGSVRTRADAVPHTAQERYGQCYQRQQSHSNCRSAKDYRGARRLHGAVGVRPPDVIRDGVRAVEALAGDALLVAQRPRRVAQRDVVLGRNLSLHDAFEHG